MGKEGFANTDLGELESLKRQIDYELTGREGVGPQIFLQIHLPQRRCYISEKSIGFSNADLEGGGIIVGAEEIMQLTCNIHKVTSSPYAKGNMVRQEDKTFKWSW